MFILPQQIKTIREKIHIHSTLSDLNKIKQENNKRYQKSPQIFANETTLSASCDLTFVFLTACHPNSLVSPLSISHPGKLVFTAFIYLTFFFFNHRSSCGGGNRKLQR